MALLKDISVGEHWGYRISDADALTEVVVRSINNSKPARVEIVYAAIPESLVDSVPPSRLKVLWSERTGFLQREAQWRAISSTPDDTECDAVSAVISEFVSPAASIGWGKEKSGTIAIHDAVLVDVFIGGGLSEILGDAGYVSHEGAAYYPWSVAIAIARRICRVKTERVMAYMHVEEMRERFEASVARTGSPVSNLQDVPIWPVWALLRDWCGGGSARADELARARKEAARLEAVLASAVGLIAHRVGEAPARSLFSRAYPDLSDKDWRAFLKKVSSLAV